MWALAVNNWKIIAAVILTAILAFGAHELNLRWFVEPAQQKALADLKTKMQQDCDDDKLLTEGNNEDFEKRITDLNKRLAAVKRMQPSRCVVPASGPPHSGAAGSHTTVLPRQDGVTSDALLEFASDAEAARQQLIACQAFVNDTWKAKGQNR